MPTKPEKIIKLSTGYLKIWGYQKPASQIIFAVIRGNRDVLRGSILVKNKGAKFFLGSVDHTRTIRAEEILAEAVPALKKHLRSIGINNLKWPHRKRQKYGFAINKKSNLRKRRK